MRKTQILTTFIPKNKNFREIFGDFWKLRCTSWKRLIWHKFSCVSHHILIIFIKQKCLRTFYLLTWLNSFNHMYFFCRATEKTFEKLNDMCRTDTRCHGSFNSNGLRNLIFQNFENLDIYVKVKTIFYLKRWSMNYFEVYTENWNLHW